MPGWQSIRRGDLVPTPWRNGLGLSRNLVTELGADGALRWQVGIADLVHDCTFSHYPHCDRIFTPIEGDSPPMLAFHGGRYEPCPLMVPKPFPGDIPTLCRVPAPGRAFNAITDRRYFAATVSILHAPQPDPVAAHIVLHCLHGQLHLPGLTLHPGDSAIGPGPGPLGVDGATILVAISRR